MEEVTMYVGKYLVLLKKFYYVDNPESWYNDVHFLNLVKNFTKLTFIHSKNAYQKIGIVTKSSEG